MSNNQAKYQSIVYLLCILGFVMGCEPEEEPPAGVASPPYGGTVWINPNILKAGDPTSFISMEYKGQASRSMFDRRVNAMIAVKAHIFEASFERTGRIDLQINPEFTFEEAEGYAELYAPMVGQLPQFLRAGIRTLSIQGGKHPWGGGNQDILIHVGEGGQGNSFAEELMIHEAGHAVLQHLENDPTYDDFRSKDPTYISTYALENPRREDVAETIGLYLALRHKPIRLTQEQRTSIAQTIPNRIEFFDQQGYRVHPWE